MTLVEETKRAEWEQFPFRWLGWSLHLSSHYPILCEWKHSANYITLKLNNSIIITISHQLSCSRRGVYNVTKTTVNYIGNDCKVVSSYAESFPYTTILYNLQPQSYPSASLISWSLNFRNCKTLVSIPIKFLSKTYQKPLRYYAVAGPCFKDRLGGHEYS